MADTPPRPTHPVRSGIRPSAAPEPIDAPTAVITFVVAWVLAQVASALVLGVVGDGGSVDTISIQALGAALGASWAVYLVGMWSASQRAGSGDPIADYAVRFAPLDIVGVGIGVLCQLVVVTLVYLPLQAIWPGTFDDDRLEETAKGLVDRADGSSMLLLFVLVVVGAPIVEELFYRGLLQHSLLGRFDDVVVVVGVAAVFALVHFRPVEYPGLFVFGLVLGVSALRTGRLGTPIAAHVGFNLTGLILVM